MKNISVTIAIDYDPDEPEEGATPVANTVWGAASESSSFTIAATICDNCNASEVMEQVIREAFRRYQNLNARKTN